MRVQNQYLKSYECVSEKFVDAPLAKKPCAVLLEQPIQEILDSLPPKERISFVRRAIGEALVREGLLDRP